MKMPQSPPDLKQIMKEGQLNLSDLIAEEGLKYAEEFNSKYLHWDEVRRRDTGDPDPKMIWALMSLLRRSSMKHEDIGGIKLRYSMLDDFQRSIHSIDTRSSAGFISKDGLNEKDARRYAISSLMEESIASSQIEGAVTTTRLAKIMLKEGRRPKNVSEQMIYNNYKAMGFIKDCRDEDLTPDLICRIHRIITKDALEDGSYSGSFRNSDDIVVSDRITGDVFHEPPLAEEVPRLMRSLCRYVNDEKYFVHPIIKAVILHFMTAYIHPFVDGNGRLARSLMYWYVLKKGYWIFEFLAVSRSIKEHRGRYDMAYLLSETDDNDITYFIRYNLKCIEDALEAFLKYLKKKIGEQDDMLKEFKGMGLNLRQKTILKDAMRSGEPFSVPEIETAFQVSTQTARSDIWKLEALGLIEKSGKEWNKILYVFSGDLSKGSGTVKNDKNEKLDKWL